MENVAIPAAITIFLNTTSPVLVSVQEITCSEKQALTNPSIDYEINALNKKYMEAKKITTVEEALAFLKSIRLSFSADSFDREDANARC